MSLLLFMLLPQMATKPVSKPGLEEEVAQVHRIRITLTSKNVKALEKGEQQASSSTYASDGKVLFRQQQRSAHALYANVCIARVMSHALHVCLYHSVLYHGWDEHA